MIHFITLHPGHFHAVLVHKEMYDGVDPRIHVYAPLGTGLIAHLDRLAQFNARAENPTHWQVEVHAHPDYLHRLVREKPGNVVVLAGNNSSKVESIQASVSAGLNVLADKPWILRADQLPRLQEILDEAEREGLVAFDIMTERFEITSILQRALVQDAEIFGAPDAGSADDPCVYMESVHFLKKLVAGLPLRRPAVYFDVEQQGEGLNDVGTHLVDLIPWVLFPNQAIDATSDIHLESAQRWPTVVPLKEFQDITGEKSFPAWLNADAKTGTLDYFCNTQVVYRLRGLWVKLDVLWGLEAEPGAGDSHLAVFRGSRSRVEIRQGKEEKGKPELYVYSEKFGDEVGSALKKRVEILAKTYPGLTVEDQGERWRLVIPDVFRTGHEAHFAEVTRQFLRYVRGEEKIPAWEKANMAAKYRVTTEGVAMARAGK